MTACTATIQGPHVPDGETVQCTREAGHPDTHLGTTQSAARVHWTDHNAGAVPHTASETPWALTHQWHYLRQYRTRGVPSMQNPGTLVAERELTGLVNAICNCGASTGWVPADSVPKPSDWAEQHPVPERRT